MQIPDSYSFTGPSVQTPVPVYNRPGLKAINYRVGDYARFKESLLARLSDARFRALSRLTTRENDDFTIALLDAWSMVLDVLTFYQERIAGESYLNTATEQFSLVELARLIGYELSPGVAASTFLAFTLDENAAVPMMIPGAQQTQQEPVPIRIEPGTRVQSVPASGERPQSFETTEAIEGRAEWNAIKPRLTRPQRRITESSMIVVSGTDNDLKAGDIVLLEPGLKLKKILKTVVYPEAKTTWIYLDTEPELPAVHAPVFEKAADKNFYLQKAELNQAVIKDTISRRWTASNLSALIKVQGWSVVELKAGISKILKDQVSSKEAIYIFRKRVPVFGYNAVKQIRYVECVTLPQFLVDKETGETAKEMGYVRNFPLPQSQWDEWKLNEENNKIYLDNAYEQILPGSFIAVEKSTDSLGTATVYKAEQVDIRFRTEYGISAKSTLVTIANERPWWGSGKDLSSIRGITIHAQAVPLMLAECPIEEHIGGETITLERLYLGLKKGQKVMVFGNRADLPGARSTELKILNEVYVEEGLTVLQFDKPLHHSYIRSSVSINANVAAATHGESVRESLGSGNAAMPFQKFEIRQPPLTFTSAATPSGTRSTLEIRVNDLLWREVNSLYNYGESEHIYMTRQDDQGKTTVIFGDGKNGARLPTGQENIKATYRKGIGAEGLLRLDQLTQLVTRPLGVRGVTNPFDTSGAEDREKLASARQNATLPIFTLGRIVSLQDYEDFARSFAGISKSLATWTWNGQKRSIYLTVAGYEGALIDPEGDVYKNLLTAMIEAGIPGVPVSIASYLPRLFRLAARILVQPGYLPQKVLATVEQQLSQKFSFDERAFGQNVTIGEVVAVMQNVAGVAAVDTDTLYYSEDRPSLISILTANAPKAGGNRPSPAELLTIDIESVNLQLMS